MQSTPTLPRVRPRKSRKIPPQRQGTRLWRGAQRAGGAGAYFLGLALVFGIALGGWSLHRAIGIGPLPLYVLGLAIAYGMVADRVKRLDRLPVPYEIPLGIGLILLGAQFSQKTMAMIGWMGPVRLLAHWLVSASFFWLLIRLRALPARKGALMSVALGGAGISALVAAGEGDRRVSDEMRTSGVTLSLIAGGLGLIVFPALGEWLKLDAREFAILAGLASPTTAEAVMAGREYSPDALAATGAWRFLVNAMQGVPVLVFLTIFAKREKRGSRLKRLVVSPLGRIPVFVWGLAGLGVFALAFGFRESERATISGLAAWCLVTALAGIGVRMRIAQIRALSPRVFICAMLAWLAGIFVLVGALLAERTLS